MLDHASAFALIPLYRTSRMESAANILVAHFRHVLIRAAYDNYTRIRFKADKLTDHRCYFNKVRSQHKRWRENGGALITWRNRITEGPHDAILLVECPASLEIMLRLIDETATVAVIYEPPNWKAHEEKIEKRFATRPRKLRKHRMRLRVMQNFVGRLPRFSRSSLATLLRARAAKSQPSGVLASPSAAARSPDTPG